MRWIRYAERGSSVQRHGLLEGNEVAEIDGGFFGDRQPTGRSARLADVQLLAPVVPPTFYAAGVNYKTHLRSAAQKQGVPFKLPTQCDIGYRASNALIGHEADIVIPPDSQGKLQFEGELVAVIGRKAKHLSEADALACVFGYTVGNDVSERQWQFADRTFWRGKNADTFKPMGPWIETELDLAAQVTTIRLNGREVSRFDTNDMIFGVAQTISTITRYNTLYPGDVIWLGTDDPTLDMVAGDVVEVDISGIGTLRNRLVAGAG